MAKKDTHYRFKVTGKLSFPLDMLRYDRCFPEGSDDAAQIGYTFEPDRRKSEIQTITLIGLSRPTDARWSSFLWSVVANSVEELY